MSFSLATICIRSNAQEGAFCLSFGMRHTAINASTDIGEVVDWIKRKFSVTAEGGHNLAVLHNRNKMVNAFAATEWVASSEGTVLSRSVTSCAGMTAFGANKSGLSQWRAWENFPTAHPNGAKCPKRRSIRKGDSGPYTGAANLHRHGAIGHERFGRRSYHHGLFEIWGLSQWL